MHWHLYFANELELGRILSARKWGCRLCNRKRQESLLAVEKEKAERWKWSRRAGLILVEGGRGVWEACSCHVSHPYSPKAAANLLSFETVPQYWLCPSSVFGQWVQKLSWPLPPPSLSHSDTDEVKSRPTVTTSSPPIHFSTQGKPTAPILMKANQ